MNLTLMAMKALIFKARAFEKSTGDPLRVQEKALFEYLERNRDTEYGRKYRFSEIKSIKDYQAFVPLSDCESLRPYITRMTKGEDGVLTSDKPIFFGLTSGTTNHPKLIPVTIYSRDRKSEVSSLWAYYISRDHPDIFKGKILAIVNSETEGFTESGCMYGTETGHGYKNLPEFVRNLYAVPYAVYNIKDYASRYYCIMRMAMEQNITTVATLNPSTILLLCRMAEECREDIINDIEHGTLRVKLDMRPEERKEVEAFLRPNPGRAGELREILGAGKKLLPKYFWPNMQLIECWKGGTVKLYLKELPQYFGDVPVRDFGCLSTEARSSIPMSDCGAGGVLAIGANFYEFVPKEEMGNPTRRFLLCDQLEVGRQYFLIVTTPGGLYRYNIDDIIKVEGYFNKTPIIEFVQKGLNVVSIMGEKVYETHVNEAINKAAEKHGLAIKFFSASVQFDKPPRYIFLVEFADEPSQGKKKGLFASIEEFLGKENAEYKYARDSMVLGEPILKVAAPGASERYRAKRIAAGVHDSQFKAPKLVADPEFQKNFEIREEI
ncbi:MAG: GH3 auxin-responsive promoter family protein [Candidatus Omnitrophota bacterium]|nr:GH3 auxin-responsive promoter family protein [Candidatus Omnitrophota bacterium]